MSIWRERSPYNLCSKETLNAIEKASEEKFTCFYCECEISKESIYSEECCSVCHQEKKKYEDTPIGRLLDFVERIGSDPLAEKVLFKKAAKAKREHCEQEEAYLGSVNAGPSAYLRYNEIPLDPNEARAVRYFRYKGEGGTGKLWL